MSGSGVVIWLEGASLWSIALSLLLAMVAASIMGHVVRRRLRRHLSGTGAEADGEKGFVLSAALGLLALLLGFTFALAVDRFETRRALVLEEANAIGTTYLRAQLLEEPHRSRISRLLVDYTDNRVEIAQLPPAEARRLLARNDGLVTELWVATVAAFPTIRDVPFSAAFLDSMNAVIDLDESRKAARQAKVPSEVYIGLFIYIVVAASLVGYTLDGPREKSAAAFLFLLITLSLMLVIDIDRPTRGGINESQGPMLRLQGSLRGWQPEVFDPPAGTGTGLPPPGPENTR